MDVETKETVQSTPAVQPAAGKSKTVLYIVLGVIVVLVLGKFALGGSMRSGPEIQQGPKGAMTYTNEQGSVTVGGTTSLPDNWPSDAPQYANGQIQSAVTANQEAGQTQSAVVYSTSDSAQVVADFYKRDLASKGWKIEQTVTGSTGTVIAATKDTRSFGLYIAAGGDGKTIVTASVSTK